MKISFKKEVKLPSRKKGLFLSREKIGFVRIFYVIAWNVLDKVHGAWQKDPKPAEFTPTAAGVRGNWGGVN